jgi:hypothetical protein
MPDPPPHTAQRAAATNQNHILKDYIFRGLYMRRVPGNSRWLRQFTAPSYAIAHIPLSDKFVYRVEGYLLTLPQVQTCFRLKIASYLDI